MRTAVLAPFRIVRGYPGGRGDPLAPELGSRRNRARLGLYLGPQTMGVGTGVRVGPQLLEPGGEKKREKADGL